jgi:hypothetical protein
MKCGGNYLGIGSMLPTGKKKFCQAPVQEPRTGSGKDQPVFSNYMPHGISHNVCTTIRVPSKQIDIYNYF